jgi:hypothetical protein
LAGALVNKVVEFRDLAPSLALVTPSLLLAAMPCWWLAPQGQITQQGCHFSAQACEPKESGLRTPRPLCPCPVTATCC